MNEVEGNLKQREMGSCAAHWDEHTLGIQNTAQKKSAYKTRKSFISININNTPDYCGIGMSCEVKVM